MNPNDLFTLLGMKEAELFALRREIAQLKQTIKATESEVLRLRDLEETAGCGSTGDCAASGR